LRKIPPGPHVIELLATFRRGNEFSFLFPWAEGGNLAELMEQKPSDLLPSSTPNASEVFARWLIEQCAGIAKGLRGMHEVEPKLRSWDNFDKKEWAKKYGIHGDLKPENILRFLDDGLGKLKLSDFGLAIFHTMATRSKQPGDGPLSPTYASPEQDGNWSFVSRKTDVWALGCVFSMLLTWAIRGPNALEEYATARQKEKDPGKKGSWLQDTFYGTEHTEDGDPLIPDGFFLKQAVIDVSSHWFLAPTSIDTDGLDSALTRTRRQSRGLITNSTI
jgi:serine/threonine protein kinase